MSEAMISRWSELLKRVASLKGADLTRVDKSIVPHLIVDDLTEIQYAWLANIRFAHTGIAQALVAGQQVVFQFAPVVTAVKGTNIGQIEQVWLTNPTAAAQEVQFGKSALVGGAVKGLYISRDNRQAGPGQFGVFSTNAAAPPGPFTYRLMIPPNSTLPLVWPMVIPDSATNVPTWVASTVAAALTISLLWKERPLEESETS